MLPSPGHALQVAVLVSRVLAGTADSTADSTAGLLTIPDAAALQCVSAPTQKPLHGRTIQIEIGRPPDAVTRLVRATYDSAGRPLDLTDVVTIMDREHSLRMYSATGRFVHDTVLGFTVSHQRRWESPADRFLPPPEDSLRGRYVEMSAADSRRVRELSLWMWRHRCSAPARPGTKS